MAAKPKPKSKPKAKSAGLDGILADPFDVAARSVYADELQTKGDPQGELIALQLAREAGGDGDPARERTLIAKHGKKWMGKLGDKFRHHVFRGGFFAGGTFKANRGNLTQLMKDPAWRLVRLIAHDWPPFQGIRARDLVDRPELVSLRAVYELYDSDAEAYASGPERPWTELGVHAWLTDLSSPLATCPSLPALDTFACSAHRSVEWIARAPVIARIRRLCVSDDAQALPDVIAACTKLGGALRELVVQTDNSPLFGGPGWRVRLLRDRAPGPFTRVVGSYTSARYPGFTLQLLDHVDASASIDLSGRPRFSAEERAYVDERLARFKTVRVDWA